MKHKFFKGFIALTMLFGSFLMASCGSHRQITGIHMVNDERMDVPYGNFSYEGVKVAVDYDEGEATVINLKEEMIPDVEKLKFYKMGIQDVKVVFRDRYETTMKIDVILNKFKDVYKLEGYECVYDNKPHSVVLNKELPEGATISYPYGNTFVNAGTYEVVGVISKHGYESKILTTNLVIHQAEHDISGITFEDRTCVYNGEVQAIEVQNVPEGVSVSYDIYNYGSTIKIPRAVNAGQYTFVARFTDENNNFAKIPNMEATLTIQKATYDLSNIGLKDYTKEYDGEEYAATLVNADLLPNTVKYEIKYYSEQGIKMPSNAKPGKYTIEASFFGYDSNNYNTIAPLTATLTVAKRVVVISNLISFESKTVNFDEETTYSLEVTGLPSNVEVSYTNNEQKYAGDYQVVATFTATNENEVPDVTELSAYLIINKVRRTVTVYNSETQQFDKPFSAENIHYSDGQVTINGFDEEVFALDGDPVFYDANTNLPVKPADFLENHEYKYDIIFRYVDENINNSVILSTVSGSYTCHAE